MLITFYLQCNIEDKPFSNAMICISKIIHDYFNKFTALIKLLDILWKALIIRVKEQISKI